MDIKQINTAIITSTFTNDQLSSIIDAVKFARARLAQTTKRAITLGSNVNFTSSKTGVNYTGVVTKIAIKYVTVRTAGGLWRVPANMLTVVAGEREFA